MSALKTFCDMERLSRFAIYLGIGMGLTFFVLFLVAALPSILDNSLREWERLDKSDASEEELRAKFSGHPAYAAMYERYPDANEEFEYYGRGDGRMMVGAMNFETDAQLVLSMRYDAHRDSIRADARCSTPSDHREVDGLFAEDFIRATGCLEPVGGDGTVEQDEDNAVP